MMITIPTKAKERITKGIKKFQPVVANAFDKDINESDTVTIISDMLTEVFGYDKYTEITSEYAVKKTFCDLAIKIDGKAKLLIEAKAIGLSLKDDYVRQAVNYGSNSGIEWVVLTTGKLWRVYKIIFSKPVEQEFVYEFDFTQLSSKRQNDLEMLYYLCKESITKSSSKSFLEEYHTQKQLLNKFFLGQLLLSDSVIDTIRKQVKKMTPDARVSNEELSTIISSEIIKREVLEGEKATDAKKQIARLTRASAKPAKKAEPQSETEQ